jgi:integrase
MPTNLTPAGINAAIRAAAAGRPVTLNDPVTAGLNLRIGKRRATWTWLGRDSQSRVRRFGLGQWPHIGLAEARRLARAMSHDAPRGADPIAEKRGRRADQVKAKGHTLAALLTLYGRQKGAAAKSWATQMEPQIKRIFREHLDAPLATLTVGALQMAADNYGKPKSASFGVRCLLTVLRWAVVPGRAYVDRSLLDLRPTAPMPSRDRVLSRDELAALLPILRVSTDTPYAGALRLILLTATRRSEVAAARWRDIDFQTATWTLSETKNGTQHIVPLSRQAVALLRSRRPDEADPMTLVFQSGGSRLNGWNKATERFQIASGTSGWTRHDLRRTAATRLGELGVAPEIVEAALNHAAIHSRLAATYNKARYRPQVADALQRLGDALDGIEQGAATVTALPLR